MKEVTLSVTKLMILLTICGFQVSARTQQNNGDDPRRAAEAFEWFNRAANHRDADLLFRALWYVGPAPRSYQSLELYTTGMAYTATVIPNWSTRGTHSGILSAGQVGEIKKLLAEVPPPRTSTEPRNGQKHLAFIYLKEAKYIRHDYVGRPSPVHVERIIKAVEDEIFARHNRAVGEARPDSSVIPTSQNPCATREGEQTDLEAMSQRELYFYAYRRSLLPPNRYRAFKCFMRRFPNDNDDMVRLMKGWVERYESGDDGIR